VDLMSNDATQSDNWKGRTFPKNKELSWDVQNPQQKKVAKQLMDLNKQVKLSFTYFFLFKNIITVAALRMCMIIL